LYKKKCLQNCSLYAQAIWECWFGNVVGLLLKIYFKVSLDLKHKKKNYDFSDLLDDCDIKIKKFKKIS
jgi:hypothetical protein